MENQQIESNSDDILSEEEKERIEMEKKKEEERKKRNKIIPISALILLILAGLAFYLHNRTRGAGILGAIWGGNKSNTSGGTVPAGGDSKGNSDEAKNNSGNTIDDPNGGGNGTGGFPGTGPGGGPGGTGPGGAIPCANPPCEKNPQPGTQSCQGENCPKLENSLCIGDNCSNTKNSCTGYYDIDLKDGMGIFFALNKDTPFGCSDEVQIKPYAEAYLSQNITKNILVEGYSCDLGEEHFNKVLSKRRAEYVKKALVSFGIPENRIKIKWYGSTMFGKAGFGTKAHYRRVQISLMKK